MTCQCATTGTSPTNVNPFNESLIQKITGLTPGDTIGTIKVGIDSCSSKTFRLAVYKVVDSDETGDQLDFVEKNVGTISTPTIEEFSVNFNVPTGETELFVVITASPSANYSQMYTATSETVNHGYSTSVKYSNLETTTSGFTFNFENESLLHVCLCTGSAPSASTVTIPPPIAMVRF